MTSALVRTLGSRSGRLSRVARVAAALSLAGAGACMTDPTPGEGPSSHIRVVQAVPNAPTVNLVVDSTLTVPGLAFRTVTAFLKIEAGDRRIRLMSTSPASTLLDYSFPLEFPRAYTVLATGMVGGVEAVVAPDTAPVPIPGEVAIRVLQASPTAGTVDMYVTDVNASLATATPVHEDMVFRGNSEYFSFPTGRYRVRLTTAGTKTVVYDLTYTFPERAMRTIVTFDATGGGGPVGGVILVDF